MPTSEPQTRGTTTSRPSTNEPGRPAAPAWPTNDLERRAAPAESRTTSTKAATPTSDPTSDPTAERPNGPASSAAPAVDVPASTTTEGAMAPTGTSPTTLTPGAIAR